jgi:hypothetical protein
MSQELYEMAAALRIIQHREAATVYGNWVMYFTNHLLLKSIEKKNLPVFHNKDLTWPLLRAHINKENVKTTLIRTLAEFHVTPEEFWAAHEYVDLYSGSTDTSRIDIVNNPHVNIANPAEHAKYAWPISKLIVVVQNHAGSDIKSSY